MVKKIYFLNKDLPNQNKNHQNQLKKIEKGRFFNLSGLKELGWNWSRLKKLIKQGNIEELNENDANVSNDFVMDAQKIKSMTKPVGYEDGELINHDDFKKKEKELKEQSEREKAKKQQVAQTISSYENKIDLVKQIWEIIPYFFDKSGQFWLWRSSIFKWERVDDTEVLNIVADNSIANTVRTSEKSEIIEAMKQYGRRKLPQEIGKRWLQFKDQVYDLEKDVFFQAEPKYFVTNPIPWKLGESTETPNIDRIFTEWVGEENVRLLYEIMAYCMIPDYPLSRIFCFVGSGMNGKSKFLELLRKFTGEENVCSTELDSLLDSRFEVTRLYKKLVCQMGETNFNQMGKTSMLKKLSGGDYINYEVKNKSPFEDVNYAKILISTNTLPATTDKTMGFYRRWIIVDFPNQFTEKKDILGEIPEEEMNNLALKCLHYLKELLNKREFHNEGSVEERMKRYEDRSNPLEKFIKEYCDTHNADDFITKKQFSKSLNQWLKANGYRSLSDVEISRRMKEMGFIEGNDMIDWYENGNFSKKRARVWHGIKFKEEESEQKEKHNDENTKRHNILQDIGNGEQNIEVLYDKYGKEDTEKILQDLIDKEEIMQNPQNPGEVTRL